MSAMYRPLPPPPRPPMGARPPPSPRSPDVLSYPYSGHSNVIVPVPQDELPAMIIPSGTLLHKGFYDLLAMIPTPLPSRILWNTSAPEQPVLVGPRYEHIAPTGTRPTVRKGRRVSKDMVSKPTGFVHLVHASDADQLEALLTRWGPDGMGKLGDPKWADPIKQRIRQMNQARAINEVVNALRPSPSGKAGFNGIGELHVVNGLSTTTSSTLTTVAKENMDLLELPAQSNEENEPADAQQVLPKHSLRKIVPSLATLEKAVAARIYFENLYFAVLRQPPSREQRRLAMENDMVQMNLTTGQKEFLRARWLQNESDYLRERRKKVDVNAFVKLKTIGHGAFGVVSLVKEKSSGNLFAMKQLRKADMLRKGQEGHIRAERDILKAASMSGMPNGADWIVKLYYSFQDRDHLYLVLEYMGGGDLLNLLIEKDVFDEDFTRFYVAEMVLAIASCHKYGFIHRDIKPDNFLFDPEGHIKLSDFGLATDLHWAHDTSYYEQQRLQLLHKHGIDLEDGNGMTDGRKTKRLKRKEIEALMGDGNGPRRHLHLAGEKQKKVSPEVIRGNGYSYSCDWWSLGVIMFECLYGFRHITRQKILNWKQSLKFPSRPRVSHEGVNLMRQLLCEPEDRLGSQTPSSINRPDSLIIQARRSGFVTYSGPSRGADGAELIKAHPWFRGIDWHNIHRYPAPYCPELRSPDDTRHFDSDIPPEPLAPANGVPADATRDPILRDKVHGEEILNVRKAYAFAGFTHKSPRAITYLRADKAFNPLPYTYGKPETIRGRSNVRVQRDIPRGRAISM
ncbi:kinase-like protein [Amanita rubescens]|nr:kinase-like protein [Amanita rubescens]